MASRLRRNVRIAAGSAALAALAAVAWAVAPAISLEDYVPDPVNFEQAVPATEKLSGPDALRLPAARAAAAGEEEDADEGRVRFLSEPFAAPKRFDLVGLTDQDTPVELRARPSGGEWSPWVDTTDGEPVWTGGSDELQLRSRDGRPHGEIGYVNVSGDATAADRALNAVRGSVNAALVSVASLVAPESAAGDAPFEVVNRAEWDPGHSCVPKEPVYGDVKAAVIHHTVNANTYTPEDAPGVVLAICQYHRYSHGWNDIGYNALVDRFGNVYAGRAGGLTNAIIGAHTAGFNSQTFGVASVGTHTTIGLSKPALESITNLLAWKLSVHGLDAKGRTKVISAGGAGNKFASGTRVRAREISRHRRFNQTSCPGRAQISRIIAMTRAKIASGAFTPVVPTPPPDGGVVP
jgi:hypothetical protein